MTPMEKFQDAFLNDVLSAPRGSRLDIYRSNSIGVRVNALRLLFPVTLRVVGDDAFDAIATDYVVDYDSTDVSLDREGEFFAARWSEVVASLEAYAELQYLPELVALERVIHTLKFVQPVEPFDWALAFEREDLENGFFVRNPSIVLFRSHWSLVSLFDETAEHIGWNVVSVSGTEPTVTGIDEVMAELLQTNQTLGALHAAAVDATFIQLAVGNGWFSKLRFPEGGC